ncbi:MAG TPA: hypothetical protein VFW16_13380 [Streptosporangiaceae bacterium]|nr:hypothetical protein [Streptosporangiaceae bacterium]
MELTPFQRFAAFAAVVLVLAGLGAYLFLPHSSAAARTGGTRHPRSSAPAAPPSSPPATAPGQPAPDIYQWLPFTQAGLASAAATTTAFARDYGTYSYTESTQAYLALMRPMMTRQLAIVIGRAFDAPGLRGTRTSARQVATATATILALRAFGTGSLTFVVAISQRITSAKGTSKQTTDYAVTLTGTGSSWQVNDIELASAGNL